MLLTLLISLSGPALGVKNDFGFSSNAPRAAPELITVRTYTGAAGREGITSSGVLNADTWVTLPGEIPSRAGHLQIERLLEIKPGRGANFLEFQVPTSNLRIPANGPTVPGAGLRTSVVDALQAIRAGGNVTELLVVSLRALCQGVRAKDAEGAKGWLIVRQCFPGLGEACQPPRTRCQPLRTRCQPLRTRCQPLRTRCQPLRTRCQPLRARCQPLRARCQPLRARCQAFRARCRAVGDGCRLLAQDVLVTNSLHFISCMGWK
jgi:hypothetical protein